MILPPAVPLLILDAAAVPLDAAAVLPMAADGAPPLGTGAVFAAGDADGRVRRGTTGDDEGENEARLMISGCVEVGGPWATTRPSLTTTTESARAIVSATACETSTRVRPPSQPRMQRSKMCAPT